MKKLPIPIVAILSLFLAPACSSKSNNHTQTCNIVTVTDQFGTNSTTYNITYDNSNRISTEQIVNGTTTTNRVFTYIGNTIIAATTSGANSSQDSITVSNGLILSDYYSDNSGATSNTIYTYNGTEVQKSVLTQGANTPVTSTYTWTNGDITGASDNGTTSSYTYNTKASEVGDYWQIIQLVNYGATFVKTAHQLAGYQTGTTIENINYTYDNSGKITTVTGTQGTSVENITYQYTCN